MEGAGAPGNDPGRARAPRGKAAMAEVYAAAGVRAPYTVLVRDDAELRAAAADPQVGFPCVIEPVAGAGSVGVTVVSGPAGAAAAADAARETVGVYASGGDPRVLVQAYAAGTEYGVGTGHSLPVRLPRPSTGRWWQPSTPVGIRNGASRPAACSVGIDEAGGRAAVQHLVERGHRSLARVSGPDPVPHLLEAL
ncbi:hypothetical protein [Streptomyces sp. NPDC017988]|uniref:hypothetical protein n=1 Tax=Streptomyces sp. NPDC017988 TaxID=3365025 RepID=UPI0037AD3F98